MKIERFVSGLLASNMYIISQDNRAVIIDPFDVDDGFDIPGVDWIVLTHEHYDHISGVNKWKKLTNATVICSGACANSITSPSGNMVRLFRDFCEIQEWIRLDGPPQVDLDYACEADVGFEGEYEFEWLNHRFRLFEMPGHSRGSIGIMLDEQFFFSGDSLFRDCDVELRLPGGSRKLWEEVGKRRLDSIPDGVKVFPGHLNEFVLKR